MLVCLCGFRGGGPDSRTDYFRLDTEIEDGSLTSEKELGHPSKLHINGFSPVCVREWTVKALRWMKPLLQPFTPQRYGRSFVWMR